MASSAAEARRFHEDAEGYLRGEAHAERLSNRPPDLPRWIAPELVKFVQIMRSMQSAQRGAASRRGERRAFTEDRQALQRALAL